MKKLLVLFALIACTGAMNANLFEKGYGSCEKTCQPACKGKALIDSALAKELCPKHFGCEAPVCSPRKSLHKVQEVVCREVEKEHNVCPIKHTRCLKRIVNVPHEVIDTEDYYTCPVEKPCAVCKEVVCKCDGCRTCHTGNCHRVMKTDGTADGSRKPFEKGFSAGFEKGEKAGFEKGEKEGKELEKREEKTEKKALTKTKKA